MPADMEREQGIIEGMSRLFGEPLSTFLLAGYGDESSARGSAFLAAVRDNSGPGLRYLEIRGDATLGLPVGREPLVWAALLLLVFDTPRPGNGAFSCRHTMLSEALGWPDTEETQAVVERALMKYARLTYLQIGVRRLGAIANDRPHRLVTSQTPVLDCELSRALAADGREDMRLSIKVEFNQTFISNLGLRWLFNREWLSLTRVGPVDWRDAAATDAALSYLEGN